MIRLLWIVILLLPATAAWSLSRLDSPNVAGFDLPTFQLVNDTLILSSKFHVNNTGFYDLTDLNFTILTNGYNQTLLQHSIFLPVAPAAKTTEADFTINVTLDEIVTKFSPLLFNDTTLVSSVSAAFHIIYVIGLRIATNVTTPWGAPLYNLKVSTPTFNTTSGTVSTLVSFDNHARFPINAALSVVIYNDLNQTLANSTLNLNAPPESFFQAPFEVSITNPSLITANGFIEFYFDGRRILTRGW